MSPQCKYSGWRESDWHRDRVLNEQTKIAYIEKLKSWGYAFDSKFSAGFNGKLVGGQLTLNK
jgi:hypothetical protein